MIMRNNDESVEICHNVNGSYIPGHLYRIFTIGGLGWAKNNV